MATGEPLGSTGTKVSSSVRRAKMAPTLDFIFSSVVSCHGTPLITALQRTPLCSTSSRSSSKGSTATSRTRVVQNEEDDEVVGVSEFWAAVAAMSGDWESVVDDFDIWRLMAEEEDTKPYCAELSSPFATEANGHSADVQNAVTGVPKVHAFHSMGYSTSAQTKSVEENAAVPLLGREEECGRSCTRTHFRSCFSCRTASSRAALRPCLPSRDLSCAAMRREWPLSRMPVEPPQFLR